MKLKEAWRGGRQWKGAKATAPGRQRIHQHWMAAFSDEIEKGLVTTVRDFGANFLHSLQNNFLDWIYIDANHQYDAVSMEIDMAIPKVKNGGYILGHDYTSETVLWGNSVIRAVNERIQSGDMKMVGITIEKFPSYMCEVL